MNQNKKNPEIRNNEIKEERPNKNLTILHENSILMGISLRLKKDLSFRWNKQSRKRRRESKSLILPSIYRRRIRI